MAYDPNDPADRAIVDAAVNEALEAEREKHEAEVAGLRTKNTELLGKLQRARAGGEGGADAAEIHRLETELDEVRGKLRTAEAEAREVNRKLRAAEGERDTLRGNLDSETAFSRNMLVENGLTAALIEAKVAPEFMEAAKAMLGKGATVKVDGDNRAAVVGDKSLGDFVKEWASSEAAKPFIAAPANGGGGAPPQGGGGGGPKKLADMSEAERTEMARTNPMGWQQLLKDNNVSIAA